MVHGSRFIRAAALVLAVLLLCTGALAESFTANVEFIHMGDKKPRTVPIEMDFDLFTVDSAAYDHQLARMSMGLTLASFRSEEEGNKDSYIRRFFEETGFENPTCDSYNTPGAEDTIACAIASRPMTDDGEDCLLIAVAVSGQGYGDEWLSNLTVGSGTDHEGFAHAAGIVRSRFDQYVERFGGGRRIKVWTVGFSRAAAVSNLFAAGLITTDAVRGKDVFAYTFATPNTTREPIPYPQIYNIVGGMDIVPQVPLGDWGFGKHGITLYISTGEINSSHHALIEKVDALYALYDTSIIESEELTTKRNWFAGTLLNMLYKMIPTPEAYTASMQKIVKELWAEKDMDKRLQILVKSLPSLDQVSVDVVNELLALVTQSAYSGVTDVLGETDSGWTNLLTSGLGVAFEHFPMRYLSYLLATDEPAELYEHADHWTYVTFDSDLEYSVWDLQLAEEEAIEEYGPDVLDNVYAMSDADMEDIEQLTMADVEQLTMTDVGAMLDAVTEGEESNFSPIRIELSGRTVLAFPQDRNYELKLTADKETYTNVNLRTGTLGKVALENYTTDAHLQNGESLYVVLMSNGSFDAITSAGELPIVASTTGGTSFFSSIPTFLSRIAVSASIYMPRLIYLIMLLLDVVCVWFGKLFHLRRHNKRLEVTTRWNWGLRACAVLSFCQCVRYLYSFFVFLRSSGAKLNAQSLMQVANIVRFTQGAWQIACAVIYVILGMLCLRACGHLLTRDRCARATMGLLITDVLRLLLCGAFHTPVSWTYWAALLLPVGIVVSLIAQGVMIKES